MWPGLPMIVPVFKLKPHTLGVPSILATPRQLVTLDKSGRASLELIWQQLWGNEMERKCLLLLRRKRLQGWNHRGRNGKDGGRCPVADLVTTSQEEDVFSSLSSGQSWTAVSILPSPLTVSQLQRFTQRLCASFLFVPCSFRLSTLHRVTVWVLRSCWHLGSPIHFYWGSATSGAARYQWCGWSQPPSSHCRDLEGRALAIVVSEIHHL